MPADMKDAPEINLPAGRQAGMANCQTCARRRCEELYTKIWTELQK